MNQPMSFMMPLPMFHPPERERDPIEVPGRVRLAVEFVCVCTRKTAPQVAANEVSIQEIEGQELEVEEREALHAACKLLTAFFQGEYATNEFEKKLLKEKKPAGEGSLIRCPGCGGNPVHRAQCQLCRGQGGLLVYPTNGG